MTTPRSPQPPEPRRGDAKPVRGLFEVLENRDEGANNRRLSVAIPAQGRESWPDSLPGQFAMLSPGAIAHVPRTDPLLPRPMAVFRTQRLDEGGARLEFLYKVVGRGTALLAEALRGQKVQLVGPLGVSFPVAASEVPEAYSAGALLVGGGTGTASLYELARVLAQGGARVKVLLGARSAADLMGVPDFEELGVEVAIATEDGSRGDAGLVTSSLEASLAEHAGALVYSCGPTPMMRRCSAIARAAGSRSFVSLENQMACGFGVCLGCASPHVRGGYALVCREGPVFPAEDVEWERLP